MSGLKLTLRARSLTPLRLRPELLSRGPGGWSVIGPLLTAPVPLDGWGDINHSRAPLASGDPPR